jgi:hypothetical protein
VLYIENDEDLSDRDDEPEDFKTQRSYNSDNFEDEDPIGDDVSSEGSCVLTNKRSQVNQSRD